jgi:hypothetical protein
MFIGEKIKETFLKTKPKAQNYLWTCAGFKFKSYIFVPDFSCKLVRFTALTW